ncbi:MAG: uL15 family ribosomal protein [Thermoplasmata archaeon]|nr:uL15 family ribosomal protein [Thermoplasmata archaeon]
MGRAEHYRGSRTHGHGKKARRGAGKRGGRGQAGAYKHRKMWMRKVYGHDYSGKYGFKRHPSLRTDKRIINVGEVARRWGRPGETISVDLTEMGYDKLLGTGKVPVSLAITVPEASPKAMEKVEAAGGEVLTTGAAQGAGEKADGSPSKE